MYSDKSWVLTDRQICDCEMILDGSFHPLKGYMTESDYNQVLENMRINTGQLFPIPIVLDVNEKFSNDIELNDKIIFKK